MGILSITEDGPSFTGDIKISAAKLDILRTTALALNEASLLGDRAFCFKYGQGPEDADQNPTLVWSGAFRFIAGATTLTIGTIVTGNQTNDALRIIRGGSASQNYADGLISDKTLANGAQTHTVTISGAGYAEGDIVEVRLYLRNPAAGARNWGTIAILYAYISPIGISDTWPTVPTFTTSNVTVATLNQLSNCADWLLKRIGQRTIPLFQAVIRRPGPYTGDLNVVWGGSITKTASHAVVKANTQVQVKRGGRAETIRLVVNGNLSHVITVPSYAGVFGFTLSVDVSGVTNGTIMPVSVQVLKTAPADDLPDTSRLSVQQVWSEPAGGSGAALTEVVERTDITWTNTIAYLNAIGTLLSGAYTRIQTTNAVLWSRQNLYRMRYAFSDGAGVASSYQFEAYEPGAMAFTLWRTGEVLAVRGKGITLGYGPGRFTGKFNELGLEESEYFLTETIIDADAVENALYWLDSAKGLYVGQPFVLRGVHVYYAAEILKVIG